MTKFGSIFSNNSTSGGIVCCLSPTDTHGPIVKTGPTAGQNRSRNKDGRWRKKRSDAGKPREKRNEQTALNM